MLQLLFFQILSCHLPWQLDCSLLRLPRQICQSFLRPQTNYKQTAYRTELSETQSSSLPNLKRIQQQSKWHSSGSRNRPLRPTKDLQPLVLLHRLLIHPKLLPPVNNAHPGAFVQRASLFHSKINKKMAPLLITNRFLSPNTEPAGRTCVDCRVP